MSQKIKKYKTELSENSELAFKIYCDNNDIDCKKLDTNNSLKSLYLKNINGPAPDYICLKDTKKIFVEIKTITQLTNKRRQDALEAGWNGVILEPLEEMKAPLTSITKDASRKFKNLTDVSSPRILLIYGITGDVDFILNAIFMGVYPSLNLEDGTSSRCKTKSGILDLTGKNISAIVGYTEGAFFGLGNANGINGFSEEDFALFFQK